MTAQGVRPKTGDRARTAKSNAGSALDRLAVTSSRPTTGAVNHLQLPPTPPRTFPPHIGPPVKGYPCALPIHAKTVPPTEFIDTILSGTYSSEYKRNFSREKQSRSALERPRTSEWITPPAPWVKNAKLDVEERRLREEARIKTLKELGMDTQDALIKQVNSWKVIRVGSTVDMEECIGLYRPRGPRGRETLAASGPTSTSGGDVGGTRPRTSASRPGTSASRPGTSASRPGTSANRPGTSASRPGTSAIRPHSTKPIRLPTLRNPTTAKLNDAPAEVVGFAKPTPGKEKPPPSRAGRPPTAMSGPPGTARLSTAGSRLHTAGSRLNTAATEAGEVDITGQHVSLSGQLEPMVLNLEHIEESTLEVLEAELARSDSEDEEDELEYEEEEEPKAE
eukprot:7548153-Pyramimonas_sp.AAC.1